MIPKFRAWNEKTKSFINYGDLVLDLESGKVYAGDIGLMDSVIDVTDQIDLMQSTGLKDKNGVEIFEGDFVVGQQYLTTDLRTPFEIKGVVKYSKRNTMFYLDNDSFGHQKFMSSLGSSIYQYEVLGNIYTNPELLEAIE